MGKGIDEDVLADAILKEIEARDVYRFLSDRISSEQAKRRMLALSREEDRHRELLTERYEDTHNQNFDRHRLLQDCRSLTGPFTDHSMGQTSMTPGRYR